MVHFIVIDIKDLKYNMFDIFSWNELIPISLSLTLSITLSITVEGGGGN